MYQKIISKIGIFDLNQLNFILFGSRAFIICNVYELIFTLNFENSPSAQVERFDKGELDDTEQDRIFNEVVQKATQDVVNQARELAAAKRAAEAAAEGKKGGDSV